MAIDYVHSFILFCETYYTLSLVEKAFGNLKEKLNLRRALVSSEASLSGKLFVEFVALISDATPEYNTHTIGRWSYIRLAAVEMENSLPQYREKILSDRCSRYDLADMPHNGKKTDFTYFISQQYENETYDYTAGAHLTMRPEIYRESYENEWIAICHQFAEAFSAVGGFCTYADYFNYGSYVETPLEELSGKGGYDPLYHEKQCTTSLNGYHWGVLLTEEHIRRLGGVERILKEAPCYKKHLWSIGGKDAIFLQATETAVVLYRSFGPIPWRNKAIGRAFAEERCMDFLVGLMILKHIGELRKNGQ